MLSANRFDFELFCFINAGVMACGVAEATGLGFVCFAVINPCVLTANKVDFGLFLLPPRIIYYFIFLANLCAASISAVANADLTGVCTDGTIEDVCTVSCREGYTASELVRGASLRASLRFEKRLNFSIKPRKLSILYRSFMDRSEALATMPVN